MNQERFEFLARKLRSREPAISAARLVLVHAVSAADAVRQTGISQPSLSRSVTDAGCDLGDGGCD